MFFGDPYTHIKSRRNIKNKMKWLPLFVIILFASLAGAQFNYYSVNTPVVESVLPSGGFITVQVDVNNNVEDELVVQASYSSKEGFFDVNPLEARIKGLEGHTFDVSMDSSGLDKGVYVGKIDFLGVQPVTVPVIMEVQSPRDSLWFDISIEQSIGQISLPPRQNSFDVSVDVFNLGAVSGYTTIGYYIKDLQGNEIYSDTQNIFVENTLSFRKSIPLSEELDYGDYVLYAVIEGEGSSGTDSIVVNVASPVLASPLTSGFNYFIFMILIFLAISFLVINYLWDRRVRTVARDWNQKVVNLKRIKFSDTAKEMHKLEYKKRLLEKAYKKRYVKKSSYDESVKRINELIRKLKKRL